MLICQIFDFEYVTYACMQFAKACITTQKIKIFEKWKKHLEITIILHKCTINDNHLMYGSWKMKRDFQAWEFLITLTIFYTFIPPPPLTIQKIKILKNWRKHLEILLFYTGVK